MLMDLAKYYVKNQIFTFIAIIFTSLYYFSSKNLPEKVLAYPHFIIYLITVVVLWNLISTFIEWKKQYNPDNVQNVEPSESFLKKNQKEIVTFIITVAYVYLMQILGFGVSSLIFLAVLSFYLGIRNIKSVAIYAGSVFGIIYAIFVMWLKVQLPTGLFF